MVEFDSAPHQWLQVLRIRIEEPPSHGVCITRRGLRTKRRSLGETEGGLRAWPTAGRVCLRRVVDFSDVSPLTIVEGWTGVWERARRG